MRCLSAALVCLWAASACARAEPPRAGPAPPSAFPEPALRELVEMGRVDQRVREGITPEMARDTAFMMRMLRTDSAHTARLRELVAAHGWPTVASAGRDAAGAAFLVLQHSPSLEFQKQMLPEVRAAAARGEVPGQDVALLTDRILMDEGRPQLYGTQFQMQNDTLVLYVLEDESRVDERRATMGLPPLDEYIRMLAEFYKAPVRRGPARAETGSGERP